MLEAIRWSLGFLSRPDRFRIAVLASAQGLTSILDLLAVSLVGVTAGLAASLATGAQVPDVLVSVTSALRFDQLSDQHALIWLGALAALLFLSRSILNFLLQRKTLRFLAKRDAQIASRVFSSLIQGNLDRLSELDSQKTAWMLTRGVSLATISVLGMAINAFADLTLTVLLVTFLFVADPVVTAGSILFFALVAAVTHFVLVRSTRRLAYLGTQNEVNVYRLAHQAIAGFREISVLGRSQYFVSGFSDSRHAFSTNHAQQQLIMLVPRLTLEISLVIGIAGTSALVIVLTDFISSVTFLALFVTAALRALPAVLRFQNANLAIQRSVGATESVRDLIASLATPDSTSVSTNNRTTSHQNSPRAPDIVLSNVHFSYTGSKQPAISGVTFSIPAGSYTALVGPSGSGKSTLADLILGLRNPDKGAILIDGEPSSLRIRTHLVSAAYVPQSVSLLPSTIRHNVAFGLPLDETRDDEIWRALDRVGLSQLLSERRIGLDTVIGEHGQELSGGQRQRLGLARALFAGASFLVLDEPTSALDQKSSNEIAAVLSDLRGDATILIISHGGALREPADQIITLVDGTVKAL